MTESCQKCGHGTSFFVVKRKNGHSVIGIEAFRFSQPFRKVVGRTLCRDHRKFSAVLETTSALRLITILPIFWPPIDMSKKTLGFNFASRPLWAMTARVGGVLVVL